MLTVTRAPSVRSVVGVTVTVGVAGWAATPGAMSGDIASARRPTPHDQPRARRRRAVRTKERPAPMAMALNHSRAFMWAPVAASTPPPPLLPPADGVPEDDPATSPPAPPPPLLLLAAVTVMDVLTVRAAPSVPVPVSTTS